VNQCDNVCSINLFHSFEQRERPMRASGVLLRDEERSRWWWWWWWWWGCKWRWGVMAEHSSWYLL